MSAEPCEACRGTGEWSDGHRCLSCGGTGEVAVRTVACSDGREFLRSLLYRFIRWILDYKEKE